MATALWRGCPFVENLGRRPWIVEHPRGERSSTSRTLRCRTSCSLRCDVERGLFCYFLLKTPMLELQIVNEKCVETVGLRFFFFVFMVSQNVRIFGTFLGQQVRCSHESMHGTQECESRE